MAVDQRRPQAQVPKAAEAEPMLRRYWWCSRSLQGNNWTDLKLNIYWHKCGGVTGACHDGANSICRDATCPTKARKSACDRNCGLHLLKTGTRSLRDVCKRFQTERFHCWIWFASSQEKLRAPSSVIVKPAKFRKTHSLFLATISTSFALSLPLRCRYAVGENSAWDPGFFKFGTNNIFIKICDTSRPEYVWRNRSRKLFPVLPCLYKAMIWNTRIKAFLVPSRLSLYPYQVSQLLREGCRALRTSVAFLPCGSGHANPRFFDFF